MMWNNFIVYSSLHCLSLGEGKLTSLFCGQRWAQGRLRLDVEGRWWELFWHFGRNVVMWLGRLWWPTCLSFFLFSFFEFFGLSTSKGHVWSRPISHSDFIFFSLLSFYSYPFLIFFSIPYPVPGFCHSDFSFSHTHNKYCLYSNNGLFKETFGSEMSL